MAVLARVDSRISLVPKKTPRLTGFRLEFRRTEADASVHQQKAVKADHLKSAREAEQFEKDSNWMYRACVHGEKIAFQKHLRRLNKVYGAMAAKNITAAFSHPPHDLGELKQLLNEFSFNTEQFEAATRRGQVSSGTQKDEKITDFRSHGEISSPSSPVARRKKVSERKRQSNSATRGGKSKGV
jgi:hypothetical protein